MYSVVLLAALTTSTDAPAHGWHKTMPYGVCYGACYGVCYTGWQGGVHAAGCWGMPYGGYWAGYDCYGGCGGYQSAAYGLQMPTVTPAPSTYAPINQKMEKAKDQDEANDTKEDSKKKKDTKKKDPLDDDDGELVRAKVIFNLPTGATLYVDETLIANAGQNKVFRTPVLSKGDKYYYELRVEMFVDGNKKVETKRITLGAGDVIKADFSELGTPAHVAKVK